MTPAEDEARHARHRAELMAHPFEYPPSMADNAVGLTLDLRGVMDDEAIARLAARNEERLKQAQTALGDRWVLWATRKAA